MRDKEQTQPKKEVSKARKIYNVVSTVLIALVFAFLVAVVAIMFSQRSANGGDVKLFGYYSFTVLTDSMQDTINPGDVILCKEVDPNTLQEEDIITFVAPSGQLKGQNITHRIKEVHRNEDGTVAYFITRGDNPSVGYDDWQLSPDNVKAKYVKTSKLIGGFRNLITQWYGYVLLIALPLCVVFVLLIIGFVKDKTTLDKQEEKEVVDVSSKLDNMSDEEKAKLLEEYLNNTKKTEDNNSFENVNINEENNNSQDLNVDDFDIKDND